MTNSMSYRLADLVYINRTYNKYEIQLWGAHSGEDSYCSLGYDTV
jgi:hypothetical protein